MPAATAVTSMPVDTPPVVTPPERVTAPTATPPALQAAAPRPTPVVIAAPAAPAATTAPAAPATPTATAPQAVPEAATAPVASLPSVAPPLDFTLLGTRLRQTKAIGVLTKLSVKNQVDDLLDGFRAYHKRQGAATLPELQRSYDMLLLKMLSLLQDSDPPLARDIVQSRAAIWGILVDPMKFTESNLMAGVTT